LECERTGAKPATTGFMDGRRPVNFVYEREAVNIVTSKKTPTRRQRYKKVRLPRKFKLTDYGYKGIEVKRGKLEG
jgi:hypothetical protein